MKLPRTGAYGPNLLLALLFAGTAVSQPALPPIPIELAGTAVSILSSGPVFDPIKCDASENLYFRALTNRDGSEAAAHSPVLRLSADAQRYLRFDASRLPPKEAAMTASGSSRFW